jgi:hypothetical protein
MNKEIYREAESNRGFAVKDVKERKTYSTYLTSRLRIPANSTLWLETPERGTEEAGNGE